MTTMGDSCSAVPQGEVECVCVADWEDQVTDGKTVKVCIWQFIGDTVTDYGSKI